MIIVVLKNIKYNNKYNMNHNKIIQNDKVEHVKKWKNMTNHMKNNVNITVLLEVIQEINTTSNEVNAIEVVVTLQIDIEVNVNIRKPEKVQETNIKGLFLFVLYFIHVLFVVILLGDSCTEI